MGDEEFKFLNENEKILINLTSLGRIEDSPRILMKSKQIFNTLIQKFIENSSNITKFEEGNASLVHVLQNIEKKFISFISLVLSPNFLEQFLIHLPNSKEFQDSLYTFFTPSTILNQNSKKNQKITLFPSKTLQIIVDKLYFLKNVSDISSKSSSSLKLEEFYVKLLIRMLFASKKEEEIEQPTLSIIDSLIFEVNLHLSANIMSFSQKQNQEKARSLLQFVVSIPERCWNSFPSSSTSSFEEEKSENEPETENFAPGDPKRHYLFEYFKPEMFFQKFFTEVLFPWFENQQKTEEKAETITISELVLLFIRRGAGDALVSCWIDQIFSKDENIPEFSKTDQWMIKLFSDSCKNDRLIAKKLLTSMILNSFSSKKSTNLKKLLKMQEILSEICFKNEIFEESFFELVFFNENMKILSKMQEYDENESSNGFIFFSCELAERIIKQEDEFVKFLVKIIEIWKQIDFVRYSSFEWQKFLTYCLIYLMGKVGNASQILFNFTNFSQGVISGVGIRLNSPLPEIRTLGMLIGEKFSKIHSEFLKKTPKNQEKPDFEQTESLEFEEIHGKLSKIEKTIHSIEKFEEKQQKFEEKQQNFEEKQTNFEEKQQIFEEKQTKTEEKQQKTEENQQTSFEINDPDEIFDFESENPSEFHQSPIPITQESEYSDTESSISSDSDSLEDFGLLESETMNQTSEIPSEAQPGTSFSISQWKPVFISDLAKILSTPFKPDSENDEFLPQKVEIGLRSASSSFCNLDNSPNPCSVLEKYKLSGDQMAKTIARYVLFMNESYGIDAFEQLQKESLTNALLVDPEGVSEYLFDEFYSNNTNMHQRALILEVIQESILILSNRKELTHDLQTNSENLTRNDDEKYPKNKTRRWGYQKQTKTPKPKPNLFLNFAKSFYFGLLRDIESENSSKFVFNLLCDDYFVFAKLIHVLGLMIYCCGSSNPIANELSSNLIDFLFFLRYHFSYFTQNSSSSKSKSKNDKLLDLIISSKPEKQSENSKGVVDLRREILLAMVCSFDAISVEFFLEKDLELITNEILENWINKTVREDPDPQCRELAVGVQIAIQNKLSMAMQE